jgi:hypothetical protein
MRRDAPHYAEAAKQLAEARGAFERQIMEEPFNQDAVQQAFKTWHLSWDHFLDDFGQTLVDALAHRKVGGSSLPNVARGKLALASREYNETALGRIAIEKPCGRSMSRRLPGRD